MTFDSTLAGVAGGMLAGVLMAALFALVVLGFAANQVGSGLALTIFGVGLSGLVGAPFVGSRRDPIGRLAAGAERSAGRRKDPVLPGSFRLRHP